MSVALARASDPRGGAWSADGTIVFCPLAAGPLQRVDASGGSPSAFTSLMAGETSHRWPQVLPDNRTALYYAQAATNSVYATTLDRPGDTKRLMDTPSAATYAGRPGDRQGHLLWSVRDTLVAQPFNPVSTELIGSPLPVLGTNDVSSFSGTGRSSVSVSNNETLLYSTGGSRFQLAWFGPDGTARGTVGAVDQYIGVRLSPDGSEALVTISAEAAGDLWRIDLARAARSRVTSGNQGWYAAWSPDASQIAFAGQGGRNLQATSAQGISPGRGLAEFNAPTYPSDWSPDGQYVVFTAASHDTSLDVWLFPMISKGKPVPLLHSLFTELHAQFSPDGKWVVFTSDESGRDDVYIQSFPDDSVRRLVSSAGGSYPRWSRGGRELLYRAADGQLMNMSIQLGGSSPQVGKPIAIMRLVDPPAVHPYPYDVASDGRILALTAPADGAQSLALTVLTNWQAALKP